MNLNKKINGNIIKNILNKISEITDSMNGVTVTVLNNNWVAEGSLFKNVINIPGIRENQNLTCALYDDGTATDEQQMAFHSLVTDIVTGADTITLYASSIPTVSFGIVLKGKLTIDRNTVVNYGATLNKCNELEANLTVSETMRLLALSDGITGSAFYWTMGKLCQVAMEITPDSISNHKAILSGLPAPKGGSCMVMLGSAAGVHTCMLLQNGTLEFYFPAITACARIDATFMYFTV